jgi:hypothetical protein
VRELLQAAADMNGSDEGDGCEQTDGTVTERRVYRSVLKAEVPMSHTTSRGLYLATT